MSTNLLVAANTGVHGAAYYMLTGTNDFEYLTDDLVTKGFMSDDDQDTLLSTLDGYRLKLTMVGMEFALDAADTTNEDYDTEAICLYSDTAKGALCGGIQYNGSSIVAFGAWINQGPFTNAVAGATELLGLVDQSDQWYVQGLDGSTTFTADGTTESFWSAFKFQPRDLQDPEDYEDDFRFSPVLTDVTPYVYMHCYDCDDDDDGTDERVAYQYYAGSTLTLDSSLSGMAFTSMVSAIMALSMLF